MFGDTDLPLALIMEEILGWEKKEIENEQNEEERSFDNSKQLVDKKREVGEKILHLSPTSYFERDKLSARSLKIPCDGFVDSFLDVIVQRLFHAGLDCLAAVVNDALRDGVNQISAVAQKLNETLLLAKLFLGLDVGFKVL